MCVCVCVCVCVDSLESYVSFAEYSLFYRALLQKRPIILRSLLLVATPYQSPKRLSGDSYLFGDSYYKTQFYTHTDFYSKIRVSKRLCLQRDSPKRLSEYHSPKRPSADSYFKTWVSKQIRDYKGSLWRVVFSYESLWRLVFSSQTLLQNTVSFIGLFCKKEL